MKITIGIDNGLDGGIVALDPEGSVMFKEVMPVIGSKGKGKRAYNVAEMANLLRGLEIGHVYLEAAQAMPKQGVSSTFSIGFGFGIWQGILSALQVRYTVVRPQDWQNSVFAGMDRSDTKRASAIVAARLAPHVDWRASERSRLPHDGLTDAFCIAEYGRRCAYGSSAMGGVIGYREAL